MKSQATRVGGNRIFYVSSAKRFRSYEMLLVRTSASVRVYFHHYLIWEPDLRGTIRIFQVQTFSWERIWKTEVYLASDCPSVISLVNILDSQESTKSVSVVIELEKVAMNKEHILDDSY